MPEHLHWPRSYEAVGTPDRPVMICTCGKAVALDEATGRFEPILGYATEHSIEDPFTGDVTVTVRLA